MELLNVSLEIESVFIKISMSKNFFYFFITCEFLIIVIYSIILFLRNNKYHFLATIETQGPLTISTTKKNEPFNLCMWSLSKNRYVEYLVDISDNTKVIYKKTNKIINEPLSRDKYFDVRVGEFVKSNYNRPFYNKKFNYCYGRTYIRDTETDTITQDNDDSKVDIDRVFVSFINKGGQNVYEMDVDNLKLVGIVKSAFPSNPNDGDRCNWNITRYYEYLNYGNTNTILPDENKSDISVEIKDLYFEYSGNIKTWKLGTCPKGTWFTDNYCRPKIMQASARTHVPKLIKQRIKRINLYSNVQNDLININETNYNKIKIFNDDTHVIHSPQQTEYMTTIQTGYSAIDQNFKITTSNNQEHRHQRLSDDVLKSQSIANPNKIYHLDDRPKCYIVNGILVDNLSNVIIYANTAHYSNPILFDMLLKINNMNNKELMNPHNFPRMRYFKYTDTNNEYTNLLDNILAITGVYGEEIMANLLIAKSLYVKLLEENISIQQFEGYLNRDFYYECTGDLYGHIEFTFINDNIDDVLDKYILLNVFDLYDGFDYTKLKRINII